jgi:translation initiation factor IF-1
MFKIQKASQAKKSKRVKMNIQNSMENDSRKLVNEEFVAIVSRSLGNIMFEVRDFDNKKFVAKLKSGIKKSIRLTPGRICIVEKILNIYEITHVYSEQREKELKLVFTENEEQSEEISFGNRGSDEEESDDEINIDSI